MTNLDLLLCSFANGTGVYNRKVEKNGDYQQIARISEHGVIKWFVAPNNIPKSERERIESIAAHDKEKFMEKWNAKDTREKFEYMTDIPGIGFGGIGKFEKMYLDLITQEKTHDYSLEECVKIMEEEFFKTEL